MHARKIKTGERYAYVAKDLSDRLRRPAKTGEVAKALGVRTESARTGLEHAVDLGMVDHTTWASIPAPEVNPVEALERRVELLENNLGMLADLVGKMTRA